jgi:hypothetical protein
MEVKKLETMDITLNDIYMGEFTISERWEGMVKLVGEKGVIIAMENDGFYGDLYASTRGKLTADKYTIVKLSPDLIPIPDKEAAD